MSNWLIEVENASLTWQQLPDGWFKTCTSGTSSESQVIPDVTITCAADIDIPAGILDPELNRDRARLRISDGAIARYFRIEKQPGTVDKGHDYPTVTGRAFAGIITDWRPLTYDFLADISASDMARLVCTQHAASRTGEAVGVVWLAAHDPIIPGGRFQVSKRGRFDLLKEIVRMCGAKLRVSTDGRNFEVYDHPDKALTAAATRTFTDAKSLSYELQRVKQPGNAIRIQGEQADYTRPTLPVISVSVSPTAIDADGTSTATASATVIDSAGLPVQHKSIVDEPVTAGSYTDIPVSGCYAVAGVWLNSGTAQAPVKGARIEPDSFTADTIVVPTQASQLFIVSYTQAEVVSWNLSDQADEITGEAQNTTDVLEVGTTNAIGRVIGVYRATDVNRSGVNYFTGGSATANTTTITLGITPGPAGTAVAIDYETYNGAPLSATQPSPASALCNALGIATATIGAGTTVGTAKITAAALGQEGSTWLSLLGSAISKIELTCDKAQILVGSRIEGQTNVSETNLIIRNDEQYYNDYTMRWEDYQDGDIAFDGYVVTSNPVAGSVQFTTPLDVDPAGYRLINGEWRIYLRIDRFSAPTSYFTVGESTVDVSYNTAADVENSAGQATITATVTQADDSPVSDGTPVDFSLLGLNDCDLSSSRSYTSSGVATTQITAGESIGTIYIYALCGSQRANIKVDIVRIVTDDSDVGTVSYPSGTSTAEAGSTEDSGESGSIIGRRRLICDGQPHAGVTVTICNGKVTQTDGAGYFAFDCGVTGSNNGTATINGEDYAFSWTC